MADPVGRYDFEARQGSQLRAVFTVTDTDLSDDDLRMQVRTKPGGDLLIDVSLGDGIEFGTDGSDGQFVVTVGATTMADVPVSGSDGWVYDIERVVGGVEDATQAIVQGRFHVAAEVTVPVV